MDDRLREIEERVAKASPGPWFSEGFGGIQVDGVRDGYSIRTYKLRLAQILSPRPTRKYDAELIANAREDIPWLIQQLRRYSEENARLRAALMRIEGHSNSYMGWASGKSQAWFDALVEPGRIARAALEGK